MTEDEHSGKEPCSFLTCVMEAARLLGVGGVAMLPYGQARQLVHAVRKPLHERSCLPDEFFAAFSHSSDARSSSWWCVVPIS
ncbi:hypothetical protein ACFV2S_05445 [Streptomyces sp. NPDC059695]|uniref:hypothetical protein n=1 Tax=Streptomyces sp. NPDC059695 TaxID=3346910 RepID=UPI003689C1BD